MSVNLPPSIENAELRRFAEWAHRELQKIERLVANTQEYIQLKQQNASLAKVKEGAIFYADGTNYDPQELGYEAFYGSTSAVGEEYRAFVQYASTGAEGSYLLMPDIDGDSVAAATGMFFYTSAATTDPGSGAGFYLRGSSGLVYLGN